MLENSTILMVRHGEKPGDPCAKDTEGDVDLSSQGEDRAQAYIGYFESYVAWTVDNSQSEDIALQYLFAAANSSSSHRPVETLTPLAHTTGLPFYTKTPDGQFGDLIANVLSESIYAGARVLICWHHGTIMDFANQLLVVNTQSTPALPSASTWPKKSNRQVFGWLLQIRYDGHGVVMPQWTRCINEHLMPDDTTDPPADAPTVL